MESINISEIVALSDEQLEMLECFFQFGEIKNADYTFVGMEEGLAHGSTQKSINIRLNFANRYKDKIDYIGNGKTLKEGWYIKDIKDMSFAEREYDRENNDVECINKDVFDATMRMQVMLTKLLDNDPKDFNIIINENTKGYKNFGIHSPGKKTAMFDWYPLPCRGRANFPYIIKGNITKKNAYYNYYNSSNNLRKKIIKNMYETYNMKCSIVYAGIDKQEFKLRKMYKNDLGFRFCEFSTGDVYKKFSSIIIPSRKPKKFLIGRHVQREQYVIMIPFLRSDILSYNDLAVIVSWYKVIIQEGSICDYIKTT